MIFILIKIISYNFYSIIIKILSDNLSFISVGSSQGINLILLLYILII